MTTKKLIFYLIFALSFFRVFAGTTGKLTGKVTDQNTGEPLIGVNILLEGTSFGVATDDEGNYLIINIPPGNYSLKVTYIGYQPFVTRNVVISTDQTTRIDVKLDESVITMEGVEVVAQRSIIQKDATGTQTSISSAKIDALPVQNFTDVLKLQAGVVGNGDGMNVRGGRGNEVAYLVDGIYVSDPVAGRKDPSIGNDAIEELKFLTGTFNAEYGNAMSGIVNVVTKEGGAEFSGGAEIKTSEFGVSPYSSYDYNYLSARLSGPIMGRDLTFFANGTIDNEGSYLPWGYDRISNGLLKVTSQPFPGLKSSLSARFSDQKRKRYDHDFKYIEDRSGYSKTRSNQYILAVTHTPASNFYYDIKGSFLFRNYFYGLDKDTSQYVNTYSLIPTPQGYEDFYQDYDDQQVEKNKTSTYNLRGDMFLQFDKSNELKAGFEFKKHDIDYTYMLNPKSTSNFYFTSYKRQPVEGSAYLQDKIEYDLLVINLGLRLDYFDQSSQLRLDPYEESTLTDSEPKFQLSPRIAIANPISEKTMIRFAYGKFLQNPDYQYFFENTGDYDRALLKSRNPQFGIPGLDAQRTTSYELGIIHQLNSYFNFNVTAYYKDILGLIGTKFYNAFFSGRPIAYYLYENESYANVKGLEFNIEMNRINNLTGSFTYTYSQAKGSSSSAEELLVTKKVYFLSFDKPHVFNGYLGYSLGKEEGPELFGLNILENFRASLLYTGSSGFPYTPAGRDIGLADRFSERRPFTWQIDAEFSKKFFLDDYSFTGFVEVINLTDQKNAIYVSPDTGQPDATGIGKHSQEWINNPSNYDTPRVVKIGLSFNF